MSRSGSMFDKAVKHYVEFQFNKTNNSISRSEKVQIERLVRSTVLEDASKIISRDLAKKEKDSQEVYNHTYN